MAENQIKMSWFQKLRQIPSNIAREKQRKFLVQDHEFIREKVLNSKSPFHVREAYKALRTNLIFSLSSEGCKKIAVTSALASEGKSTNCLNLAITFAEMDAKVLIIDCDLRRPNLARLLDVQNAPGLSNYLVGLNTSEEVVRKSIFNNLSYITAGNIPPNPVELLSSENMARLMEKLEKEFDYIFLDTPPVNLVIDTVAASKYVHGVVMIALQNSTDKEAIRYALGQLNFAGTKVLGFVLNGVVYGNNGAYKNVNKRKYYRYFSSSGRKKGSKGYGGYGGSYGGSYGNYGSYKNYGNYSSYGK
ncbi:MAG: CpsD/CapB family tyrosine-protein kinase [Ruminococcaceae bacterium]|nr:CpsD/CapB family tyrosine-protein kinase [Oscillospiraceae bacterium]